MPFPDTVTLLFNGLTLALALGFLLIVLSQEMWKEINQFFAIFLFLVILWNAASLLAQALLLVDQASPLVVVAIGFIELGFTGSSVAAYVLTAVLVGNQSRRFHWLAFASLAVVLGYQLFLIVNNHNIPTANTIFNHRPQPISSAFYITFNSITLLIVWRHHQKLNSRILTTGITLFTIGQSLSFLNPELRALSISTTTSSIATLITSFAILRKEIIIPLAERAKQVEAIHKVSLAITSQININTVLTQIATQAAKWLDADAAGIFLNAGSNLELATVHNLPTRLLQSKLKTGQGIAGTVANTHQSIRLENYKRQWQGEPDLPLAQETFGSVICVPLTYTNETIGVLMVIAGQHGRLFEHEHVHLLELLGAQAAVAIANSRLFAHQNELTQQIEAARSQLETLLISTENPVIATDRHLQLIFANPAARMLFSLNDEMKGHTITDLLPKVALPPQHREALRNLHRKRVHVYEISLHNKVFLCHLAKLGSQRTTGWVAVLNDVTQLKELDRLKSEMVRMTSHDLKNPLQAAMAHLELLEDDLNQGEISESQQTIATIQKQMERMNHIIEGVLDLERIQTGTPTVEITSPEQVIKRAVEEVNDFAKEQNILLGTNINTDSKFLADPTQFQRALTNLIENAIKFTPPGGSVNISVDRNPKESQLIFQVEDTGIGIPQDLQPMVFDRFFRGGQKGQKGAEHVSGSGLGLTLVKTIIENHEGKVWLSSREGKGTTFFIAVPDTGESKYHRYSNT